jgi:glycosyltransferase involved in cell wall biosynthesis
LRRVSIFISNLDRGGAEKQALILAKCLNPYYEVDILIFYPENQYLQFIEENKLNIITLKGSVIKKLYSLLKYFRINRDTVLFNYSPINNALGTIIGKLAGIRKIYCGIRSAGFVTAYYKVFIQKIICNRYSDLVIANSFESLKNYSEAGFNVNKFKVIHNCIELPDFQENNYKGRYINILTISRFINFKGIDCSIRAIEYLITKYPYLRREIRYKLVGYGLLQDAIENQISASQLKDIISIHDGRKDVTGHYKDSHIYLSTSLTEGLSNSIMEAMSFSLPVVATDVGDNRFLVKEGINGYLCNVNDYISIAEALYKIISDENTRNRFSSMSLSTIRENFSTDIFTQEYLKLVEN